MTPHIAQRLRTASRPLGALATVLSLTISALVLTSAPAAAAESPTTGFARGYTAPNGLHSDYHLYADGIDRSKPVGVAFYFDGDGQYWAQRPSAPMVQNMARSAAAHNMVLVVPVAPDRSGTSTWWERLDANGEWFRALSAHLVQRHGLDTSRVWLAGYSGGAQFITKEVLADRQNWIRGGGAVVVGGGGARDMQTAPSAAVRSLSIRWTTGSADVAGSTQPPTWSALAAARNGRQHFTAAGFTGTRLHVPAGVDHHDYAQDAIFASALAAAPATARWASFPVGDAIGAAHRSAGGTAVLGRPVMAEHRGLVLGGAYQEFARDGRKTTIYWTPRYGAHVVKNHGAIGRAWVAAGREHGYGMPTTDEIRTGGTVRQSFSNGYTVHWSPATHRTWVTR